QVVEQEQELAVSDVSGEAVLGSQRLRDRLGDERGIAQGSEPDPEDARLVGGDEGRGGLERQTRLARAAWTGEREQTRTVAEAREHLLQLALATDEGARRTGEVRVRDRLQRREGAVAELVQGDRLRDVLQAVLAELVQMCIDED